MERRLGVNYAVSIGTALIFESEYFDISKWPNNLYINLRTLYRNYVASIALEDRDKINKPDFIQEFLDEVTRVEQIIQDLSANRISILFYYPEYKQLEKVLPMIERKNYNPGQFDELEEQMWRRLKRSKVMIPFHYVEIDTELPTSREKTMVLTSFVIDLLSYTRFPILMLIESYTGKIKKREDWWTKINIGKGKLTEGVKIPFNRFTIQVFGDKSGALKPHTPAYRPIVRQMAFNDNWTPLTSNDKIKHSIGKLKDLKVKQTLLTYL